MGKTNFWLEKTENENVTDSFLLEKSEFEELKKFLTQLRKEKNKQLWREK